MQSAAGAVFPFSRTRQSREALSAWAAQQGPGWAAACPPEHRIWFSTCKAGVCYKLNQKGKTHRYRMQLFKVASLSTWYGHIRCGVHAYDQACQSLACIPLWCHVISLQLRRSINQELVQR